MKIATTMIMRNIDNYCIDVLGIPGIVLMENAALKVIKNISENILTSEKAGAIIKMSLKAKGEVKTW